jgi:AraC-like DNA-binding protein
MTRLACAHAKQQGIGVEPLLRKAGLAPEQIDDTDARLDVRCQIKFLDLIAAELNDEFLGFHLAQSYDLRMMGLLYYTQASSETVGEALRRGARYSSIVNEGIALKFREAPELGLDFDYVGISRHSDRHQIEFAMVTLLRVCRQLTKRQITAIRANFTHRRHNGTDELRSFFGGDIAFGATEDRLAFSTSLKVLPVVSADPYLNDLLTGYCEQAIANRAAQQSQFSLKVENAITLLLPHGKASAPEIARKLGVSRRTMARRLSSEGLTFASVMQTLKRDLAKRHLADETLSISEIAWLLGYQDVSAFTHAFKRWTGTSPRAVRAALK